MSHADLVALRGAHSIDGDDGPAKDCGCGANEPDADVSNALPTAEALKQCAELPVYDAEGKVQTFKSLVDGDGSGNKHMVVFIRHFFCGVSTYILLGISHACVSHSKSRTSCRANSTVL